MPNPADETTQMLASRGIARSSRVAVAVSGGVDSLCTLWLLKEAGLQPIAIHGHFLPDSYRKTSANEVEKRLVSTCKALDIPLKIIPLQQIFHKRIIAPFARAYADGLVPNPCAICNRIIKFGALLGAAFRLGAHWLATGHYARIISAGNQNAILAQSQLNPKDQSYFLSLLSPLQLKRAIFPLEKLRKDECREIVARAGLEIPAPEESQDICFLSPFDGDYRQLPDFGALNHRDTTQGPIVLARDCCLSEAGIIQIGIHRGLWRYTIGQRRGLGLPYSEALHVLKKDYSTNTLVVGPKRMLAMRVCVARCISMHLPPEMWPPQIYARLRHNHELMPVKVIMESGKLHIELLEARWPTTPGQIAALYDNAGRVLAGGIVEKVD